ncbi:MAG: DUF4019 domain-containing protein [Pirellulales bacterium]
MNNKKVVLGVALGCGVVGLAIVLLCSGALFFSYRAVASGGDVSVQVDSLFKAMADGKFRETYTSRTSPEFRRATTETQYSQIGATVQKRLGALKSKQVVRFNARQFNLGSFIEVVYNAQFEKGAGTITLTFKRAGDDWLLHALNVSSPTLLEPAEPEPEPIQAEQDPTIET